MLKRILSLLLIAALCFCFPVLAENAEEETKESFRSLPGYTCFPLSADSNEEYPGHLLGTFLFLFSKFFQIFALVIYTLTYLYRN